MESVVVDVTIGLLLIVFSVMLAKYVSRKRHYESDKKLESAIDDLVRFLKDSLNDPEGDPAARQLFYHLRGNHSINHVVAAFYLLRERKIIRWYLLREQENIRREDDNILKPDHLISLVVR